MGTLDELLPPAARPYSELLLGAGAGALIAHFGHFTSMKRGALYGAALGLGVSLLKPRASWPSFWGYPGRFFVGDSVTQFPTRQLGYAQPYQSFAQQPYQSYPEIIPGYAETPYSYEYETPEWDRGWRRDWRRPDWRRYGHEWRGRSWGHHW